MTISDRNEVGKENPVTNPPKLPQYPWIGKRPFYGWVIVAVGVVTQFLQGIISQGFATYLSPLQRDFGWSKAVLAGPRSVTQVETSILGPLEGFLMDRFGPRRMVTTGVFIMGLGLILFGLTNSLWMYYLSNIIIALGTGLQGLLIMSIAVNNWFRRKRTMAQSIMLLGFSLAGVVGIPALVLAQTVMGWQTSAIGSGLIVWAVGFPCSMLLRTRPELYGLKMDGDMPEPTSQITDRAAQVGAEYDFTLREALHTHAFWFLALGWAVGNMGIGAAHVHIFLHLEEGVGLERTTAALVWTVASLSNIPSRLVAGFLGDRLPKNLMIGFSTLLMAVSVFILGIADTVQMAFIFAVLYGIGWGIRTPVMNALQGEYFGRKSQGIIRGWLQSLSLPFTISAPVVAGYIADIQGNYRLTFIVLSFLMLVGASLLFMATNPQPAHPQE
ncbi:MFS transporter [Chloroflexota bacterium]